MTSRLVTNYPQIRLSDLLRGVTDAGSLVRIVVGQGTGRESVYLTSTSCHFGGSRLWLVCPICSKRAGVLYERGRIGCRNCHGLAYPSQRENRAARARRRARKGRAKLETSMELGGPIERPRGMHAATFKRHERRILEAEAEELKEIDRFLARAAAS